VTQTYNNCAETHLGDGVMSPFVSPLSAIAQAHDPTLIGSGALRKGPRRFCSHRSDRCVYWRLRVETHPCGNVVSAVIMFCLRFGRHGSINWTAYHHVKCALIGMSRELAAYNPEEVRQGQKVINEMITCLYMLNGDHTWSFFTAVPVKNIIAKIINPFLQWYTQCIWLLFWQKVSHFIYISGINDAEIPLGNDV